MCFYALIRQCGADLAHSNNKCIICVTQIWTQGRLNEGLKPVSNHLKTYYAINLGKKPLLKVSAKIFIFEHLQEKKKKIIWRKTSVF